MRLAVLAAVVAVLAGLAPAGATAEGGSFSFRGIIEGFYGTPYTHAERMDLIRWEASHGMNVFVDAPKEDPYVRTLWRHQYPPAQLAGILDEVRLATSLGVAWVPDVGPGVPEIPSPNAAVPDRDICFSCAADFRTLVDKFRPFVAAGARMVMVSFDDTLKVFTHPEDVAAYGTGDAAFGTANAQLLDRLAKALPGVTVLTVPADYSGTSPTPYLAAFAEHLDQSITVMWTGTQVIAPTIKGSDAEAFDRLVGRQVVVWDNYPVNDYAGGIVGDPTNLFLGPVTGRGADLVGRIKGIVANPMGEWQASKIPLATLADDLADPYTYDPETSWQRAITDFAGRHAPQVAALADNSRSSPLGQSESIIFRPEAASFLAAYRGAAWVVQSTALRQELLFEQGAPAQLRADRFNPEFLAEAAPFLDRLALNATTGLHALAALTEERPSMTAHLQATRSGQELLNGSAAPPDPAAVATQTEALATLAGPLAADHHNVHGYRFGADANGNLYANQNLMDRFISSAGQLTAAWLPTAPAAASQVRVTVNGQPAPDSFRIVLPAHTPADIVATDGAGGQTEVVLAPI